MSIDWGSIGKTVGGFAPVIGGLLGGPAGATAGALLAKGLGCENTPAAVSQAIQNDPEAFVKIKQIESNERVAIANIALEEKELLIKAGSQDLENVNVTMREESKSEDPWTRRWRPYNGYMFGTTMFCTYFMLPFMNGFSWFDTEVPEIPYFVWVAWASVLGVASWHRGMKQRLESGEVGQPGIMGAIANRIKR